MTHVAETSDLRPTTLLRHLMQCSSQALHEKASCSGCSGSDPPGMSRASEAESPADITTSKGNPSRINARSTGVTLEKLDEFPHPDVFRTGPSVQGSASFFVSSCNKEGLENAGC